MLLEDFTDGIEVLVQQILLMILDHPLGQNRAAPADDSRDALAGQRNILHQHAGMDGHVIHALLSLFLDHFEQHLMFRSSTRRTRFRAS